MTTKTVELRQLNGITLAAKGDSNHWIMMDGDPELGGSSGAPKPKELVLMALAGCTAMDVIPILKKKRAPLTGFGIKVTGTEREEHPRIFTDIHVEYLFYGDGLKLEDVERAIELSKTKYCSVSAILGASAKMSHSYQIKSPSET
ncbi:MAG: osmotically inducible protein OsmC [Ignavibacteria bacterium]|nr:osmotically inducible protein OsmC [Ignavibacteria bacterium]